MFVLGPARLTSDESKKRRTRRQALLKRRFVKKISEFNVLARSSLPQLSVWNNPISNIPSFPQTLPNGSKQKGVSLHNHHINHRLIYSPHILHLSLHKSTYILPNPPRYPTLASQRTREYAGRNDPCAILQLCVVYRFAFQRTSSSKRTWAVAKKSRAGKDVPARVPNLVAPPAPLSINPLKPRRSHVSNPCVSCFPFRYFM